jgi:hypothetical protein
MQPNSNNAGSSNAPAGVTFDAPTSQATTVGVPAGVSFDAPTNQATTVTVGQPSNQPSQPSAPTAPSSTSDGSFLGNVGAGINKGLDESMLGAEKLVRRTPIVGDFLGQHAGLDAQIQHDTPVANQPVQGVGGALGYGGESLGEFLLGDSALKGAAWSDKLLTTGRIAKVIESSPRLAKVVQLGIAALRAGTVQGGDALLRTGDPTQAGEQGAVAAGIVGGLGAAGATVQAIRSALDVGGIQKPLQDGIKAILSDAATKAGVPPPTAPSIRDAAQQVSDAVRLRASGLYQSLDEATGGQAQRFRDAAKNVADKLSEIVGLDDEKEAELVKRQAEIDAAHKAMLAKLQEKGYDPNLLQQADAAWKHQSALSDLSASIRQSATGLRPELANTAKGATTPEAVNPKTLFVKINRLNDRGRLAQAIGTDNANALLQHVDEAYVKAQKIAATNKWAKYGLGAASSIGLGGVGYAGVHLAHELLGGQ